MININFEQYKVFYHVAKNLSFSLAAKELYISQSAISQSVKILEGKLNCQLFLRVQKKIVLTHEGDLLFRYVEQAYESLLAGQRSIASLHTLQHGEIKLAASDTICKHYLLPYIQQFSQLYPEIKFKITNRTSPVCIDLLAQGKVDLSIVNIPYAFDHPKLTIINRHPIRDVLIAGKSFAYLAKQSLTLQDLSCYPFLMLEKNTVTRQYFDALVTDAKVHIIPEVELGSVELLIELVKIGLGLSFVVEQFVQQEIKRGELFVLPTQETIAQRYLGATIQKNIPLPPAAQTFLSLLIRAQNN